MAQQLASTILAQFATNIDAITSESTSGGFKGSGYRLTLGEEPDSAIDGLYFVDMPEVLTQGPHFGNTEDIWEAHVTVEVGYYRGGGDLGGGDRQSVLRNAASDVQRIADVLTNPANYAQSTTGIREVRFLGAERAIDKAHAEVWRVRFWCQWQSSLITA